MNEISYPAFPEALREKRREWVPVYPGRLDEHFYVMEIAGVPCTAAIGVSDGGDGLRKLSILVVHHKAWEEDLVTTGGIAGNPELAAFSKRHSVRLAVRAGYSAEAVRRNPECFTRKACAEVAKVKAAEYCDEADVAEPFRGLVEAFCFDTLCEGVMRAKGRQK